MTDVIDDEIALLHDAAKRAEAYLRAVDTRRAFPDDITIAALDAFDGALPQAGKGEAATLRLLDEIGSPATVTSNGPNYFGFVLGGTLPVAAAAERLAAAWDQCASNTVTSPVAARLEKTAAAWLLDVLDLPRDAGVAFGTSATACSISCLATARRHLLAKAGWDVDRQGLAGAPAIRLVVSDLIHVTLLKGLKVLGFGSDNIVRAPVDECGRVIPDQLPPLDNLTILCLQAGEVNTGEFDPFAELIPAAKAAGAWVHVDGAFGLWARASARLRHLADGVELADSWTTDGHKTLNTPYDGAVAICRDRQLLAGTMNAAAVYVGNEPDAQMHLGLEFSRRGRGIAFWAVMHALGRDGIAALVERYCDLAGDIRTRCEALGLVVLNRGVFNQVLCTLADPDRVPAYVAAIQANGVSWFGTTLWQGKPALRISVSSWRTREEHIERLAGELERALADLA